MSETAIIARLEDIAALHRSRGAHRDCRVHDDFEPDCWFCQVTVIEDAVATLRAGAEALRGHDPLTGLPPDGPKCRRHGIYKLAVAHYYCEACAKEGRATVGPASAAAEPEPRA